MEIFVQKDAPLLIRRGLRHLLPGHRVVAQSSPDMDATEKAFITVQDAGTPSHGIATSAENVHVTVYAASEPEARQLASLIDGLLLNPTIPWGFSISPGPGLLVVPDDDLPGVFLASVTVVAQAPKDERILQ